MIKKIKGIIIYMMMIISLILLIRYVIILKRNNKEEKNKKINYMQNYQYAYNKNTLLEEKIITDYNCYDELENKYNEEVEKNDKLENTVQKLKIELAKKKVSRGNNIIQNSSKPSEIKISQNNSKTFIATAYDLSVASCGKSRSHPQYGITRSGRRATVGRTIAVDPRVIPLGTRVYVKFNSPYSSWSGYYVAEDTGGAIKGNRIDLFIGENKKSYAYRFGRRQCEVIIK